MTGHEIAVITGASAGVGRATAREFAKHGAWIGLLARDETALEHAKREVEGSSEHDHRTLQGLVPMRRHT